MLALFAGTLSLSCSDDSTTSSGGSGGAGAAQAGAGGSGGTSGGAGGGTAGGGGGSSPVGTPLRTHPTRSGLFAGGRDDAAVLSFAGSHSWYNITNNPDRGITDNDGASFGAFLDFMEGHGQNFTRLWTGFAYLQCSPFPWPRPGPGAAQDGEPQFDLSAFEQPYFDMLRERLTQLESRGLYAAIMFFGSHNGFDNNWTNIAWHPDNNINDTGLDPGDGRSFFDLDNVPLRDLQEGLIRKYVDELNGFHNIIFEIINEAAFPDSAAWQSAMVEYAQDYEAALPQQHLFGITADYQNSNEHLLQGPHDWWSPDGSLVDGHDYRDDAPADYDAKPVIVDSDHFDGGLYYPNEIALGIDRVWRTFLRGNHPILMDCYTAIWPQAAYACAGEVNPVFDPIRDALGATVTQSAQLHDLAATMPSETACSTRYCLVNPGQDYLVYQPDSGGVEVDLEPGDYEIQWLDPMTGQTTDGGPWSSTGGTDQFDPPHSGMALLWLSSTASP